ncbi:MAG: PKD domain-containing protein [Bacteroidales bacterium]|nr:PKD domain-containing protein [Bacteroidales bacterium]
MPCPTKICPIRQDLPGRVKPGNPASEYNWQWSTGQQVSQIEATQNGRYTATITDAVTGCQLVQPVLAFLFENIDPGFPAYIEQCDSLVLDAKYSQANILWSTGETSRKIKVKSSGTYMVSISESNGGQQTCAGGDTVEVVINQSPKPALEQDYTFCGNESLELAMPNRGNQIEWNDAGNSLQKSITQAGFFWVKETTPQNCATVNGFNVSKLPYPQFDLGADTSFCENQHYLLIVNALADSYRWADGVTGNQRQANYTGLYKITATNNQGCSFTDSVNIAINPVPVVNIGPDTSICFGQQVSLDVSEHGETFAWNNGWQQPALNVTETGNYQVEVTNSFGCSALSNKRGVTVLPVPFSPFSEKYLEVCDSVKLFADNPGALYQWGNGSQLVNLSVYSSGLYKVHITNAENCSISDSAEVLVTKTATPELQNLAYICEGNQVLLNAGFFGSGYSYFWNTGESSQVITAEKAGTYKVSVTHEKGCQATDSTVVKYYHSPEVDLGSDAFLCKFSELVLDAGNPESLYQWGSDSGFAATTRQITVQQPATYWVLVMTPDGCTTYDTIRVSPTEMSIEPEFLSASLAKVGDTIQFVDVSNPTPWQYYWDFGDLTSAGEKAPTHIYYSEGVYNVMLQVSNSSCEANIRKDITINGYNKSYLAALQQELENRTITRP